MSVLTGPKAKTSTYFIARFEDERGRPRPTQAGSLLLAQARYGIGTLSSVSDDQGGRWRRMNDKVWWQRNAPGGVIAVTGLIEFEGSGAELEILELLAEA
jgi:hypothetical protein